MQLSTISLNSKNYSRVNSSEINSDLYDVNDFIRVNNKTYYANKKTREGVSKNIRRMISM